MCTLDHASQKLRERIPCLGRVCVCVCVCVEELCVRQVCMQPVTQQSNMHCVCVCVCVCEAVSVCSLVL